VWFNLIYTHNLIYNACWEDPRVDRVALNLGPDDTLLVITSAGCNVLDYALLAPQHIYAVDMNYRQSALLELKLAAIKALEFEQFFAMFGYGCLDDCRAVYETQLRTALSPVSQAYWDRHIAYFSGGGWRRTFYFNGTAGIFARLINTYMDQVARVRDGLEAMLHAASVAEQCVIYESYLRQALWSPFVRWLVNQDVMLTLLGVPPSQRQQVERHYYGGIVQFIEECVETVFARLPLRDNYFWRLYMCGAYTPDCCPEYLKRANFERLKAGLAERISVHTSSLLHSTTWTG
jgi:S-adenosylmethionine-diacylglycerol 3-amino-3-carboxypropyl transferase